MEAAIRSAAAAEGRKGCFAGVLLMVQIIIEGR